jgi:anti-sigma28 factor (negative regulator of flagellin synthesis)
MSVRIQTDHLAGTQAAETSRAKDISQVSNSSSAKAGKAGGSADNVEISSLSEGIAAANSAQQAQQTSRVHHLASLFQSGNYHVDSSAVSKAMVSSALGNAGGAE